MKYSKLEILIGHYYTVRAGLESARTSMPDAEELSMDIQVLTTHKSRESLEYRKALVADVQKYLSNLHWCDMYVLMCQMRPDDKSMTWPDTIRTIQALADGRHIKAVYRRRDHIANKYWDWIYPRAGSYFRRVGYLR